MRRALLMPEHVARNVVVVLVVTVEAVVRLVAVENKNLEEAWSHICQVLIHGLDLFLGLFFTYYYIYDIIACKIQV